MNDACRQLFGPLEELGPPERSLRCCDVACGKAGGESTDEACLTEEAFAGAGRVREVRIDLPEGGGAEAAWMTVSRLERSGLALFHIRPAEGEDRPQREEPSWITTPRLRIFALGQTRMETAEGPAGGEWLEQRPGQLLKFLVSRRGDFVTADEIAEAFWPQSADVGSLASVRYLVHTLRSRLEPDREARAPSAFVLSRRGGYMLDGRRVWIDADEFEELVAAGLAALVTGEREAARNRLRRAMDLYHGDFLADERYSEWALAERDRLSELAGRALRALIELGVATSDLDSAASHARRLADMQPYDEDSQRRHIEMCITRGRRGEAVRRYRLFRGRMLRDFGEEPSFELSELSD
jgi:DNA-binding SARP family transcriptional activator